MSTLAEFDRLVWIDVETTGVHPHYGDRLLEIACLITDPDLNLLDETGFHRVVQHDADEVTRMRARALPIVQQMHDRTGLWGRVPDGSPIADVERDLLEYVKRFAPNGRQGRIAGSSIRLDFNTLEVYLPAVADHLHYRTIDVSTMTALTGWWLGPDKIPSKAAPHEAMADIRGSLDELRALRQVWSSRVA